MKKRRVALLVAVVAVGAAASADAREKFHHRWLVNSVTAERIHRHLERLQAIASRNDDTRALGTPGYKASVRYVVDRLRRAHYHPVVQEFTANLFEEHSDPVLDLMVPDQPPYEPNVDFTTMQYSGAGDVTADLVAAGGIVLPPTSDPSSASGCAAGDFTGASGKIVLVQRGTCTFEQKAQNAASAGAVGW